MSKSENMNFMLVNPYVASRYIPKIYQHKAPEGAAKQAWESITKYITGKLDTFHITMQRVSDKSLHHFKINETEQDGGGIKFSMSRYLPEENAEMTSKFLENLNIAKAKGTSLAKKSAKLTGGKHKKKDIDESSSSDSSSDDDYYKQKYNKRRVYVEQSQPIYYWWYDPSIYRIDRFYSPTFISPLIPPIEVTLSYNPFF
jgi:hypothetical protein